VILEVFASARLHIVRSRRRGLSAVLTTPFTVSEGFGIMEGLQLGSQLVPQASLPKSLVNNDEVFDVLMSSLFSSWLV